MKVVNINEVPVEEIPHVREGVFRTRRLLTGDPNSPGNFALQLVNTPETYYSPRHRHNFDQVRYQIEGDFDLTTDGIMHPGDVAYFPEGTRYGPQDSKSSSLTLVLQFGGVSGSGYLSTEQYENARQELLKTGTFDKGVFTRTGDDGKKINKDAYEAVWEQVNGRALVYPRPRYNKAVFMQPGNFNWVPLDGQPGVSAKLLGVFSERRIRIARYRIEAGASLSLEDNAIFFIDSGSGKVDGKKIEQHGVVYLDNKENAVMTAEVTIELLQLGLPYFAS